MKSEAQKADYTVELGKVRAWYDLHPRGTAVPRGGVIYLVTEISPEKDWSWSRMSVGAVVLPAALKSRLV